VGQTPPPFHGQAVIIHFQMNAKYEYLNMYLVRMHYSNSIESVGKFQTGKVVHLVYLIIKTIYMRYKHNIEYIRYHVASPNLIPIVRDLFFLSATRLFFKKVIFEFNAAGISNFLESHSKLLRLIAKVIYHRPDGAIIRSNLNPPDADYFQAKKIFTVPNGIPDEAKSYFPIYRKKTSSVTILYTGMVSESKGILVLLEAIGILSRKHYNLKAIFIGDYESTKVKHKCNTFVKTNQLSDIVSFVGVKIGHEKWDYFRKADIFCFPTHYETESFGLVLIEAMMFGLPIVATNWRAIPDIVDEGENGFLFEIKDSTTLSEKLAILVDNSDLRDRFGKNGRDKYEREYTLERHIKNLETALVEIVQSD
jgi:glycosyltransferase involved in cell wall biosynthesis